MGEGEQLPAGTKEGRSMACDYILYIYGTSTCVNAMKDYIALHIMGIIYYEPSHCSCIAETIARQGKTN